MVDLRAPSNGSSSIATICLRETFGFRHTPTGVTGWVTVTAPPAEPGASGEPLKAAGRGRFATPCAPLRGAGRSARKGSHDSRTATCAAATALPHVPVDWLYDLELRHGTPFRDALAARERELPLGTSGTVKLLLPPRQSRGDSRLG